VERCRTGGRIRRADDRPGFAGPHSGGTDPARGRPCRPDRVFGLPAARPRGAEAAGATTVLARGVADGTADGDSVPRFGAMGSAGHGLQQRPRASSRLGPVADLGLRYRAEPGLPARASRAGRLAQCSAGTRPQPGLHRSGRRAAGSRGWARGGG
jgi:hypothetical protein